MTKIVIHCVNPQKPEFYFENLRSQRHVAAHFFWHGLQGKTYRGDPFIFFMIRRSPIFC